jgi:hypothetical protein
MHLRIVIVMRVRWHLGAIDETFGDQDVTKSSFSAINPLRTLSFSYLRGSKLRETCLRSVFV